MEKLTPSFTKDKDEGVVSTAVFADPEKHGLSPPPVGGDTERGLSNRMVQMISIGGCIGTGLFVGSGAALAKAGPLGCLLAYIFMSSVVWAVSQSLGEMSSFLPIRGGGIPLMVSRYVDRSLAFALGWNYVYAYFMLVCAEVTAAGVPEQIVVEFWTSSVNVAVWISIFLVVITLLNSLSVRFYGETESYFASLKIILILGLILLTFITMVGGGPSHHAFGFSNWNKPSPMVNPLWLLPVQAFDSDSSISDQNEYIATGAWGRFLAFWSSMISAGFSFIFGPELITVASGETQNPRRNIPKATRRFVYRIVFFYVGGILSIGILVSSQNPSLLNAIASGTSSGAASPFVIGIREQGIKVLPSIVNAVILTSAWSSGNSFMYAGARVLHGLAKDRHAPSFFARTHHGVPLYAVGCAALIGCLSYLNVSSSGANVFTWFQNITTISGFLSWIVVLITHFRFRAGLKAQGVSISSLPFRAKLYPYAPIYALIVVSVITLTNGFAVFTKGRWSTSDFVAAYIGLPIFAFFYLGHKIVTRSWDFYIPAHLIDITTGRAEIDEEERLDRQNFVPPTTFNEKFVEWLF